MSSANPFNRPVGRREMTGQDANNGTEFEQEGEEGQDVHERSEQKQEQEQKYEEGIESDDTDDNSDVIVPMVGSHPVPIDSDKKMVLKRSSSTPSISSAASSSASLRALGNARESHGHHQDARGWDHQEPNSRVQDYEETEGADDSSREEGIESGSNVSNVPSNQVDSSGIIEEKEEAFQSFSFEADNPHTFPPSSTEPATTAPFTLAAEPAPVSAPAVDPEATTRISTPLPSSRNTSRRYFQIASAPLPSSSTGEQSFSSLSDPFRNDQEGEMDTTQAGSRHDHPQYDSTSRMMSSHRGRGYRRSSSLPDYRTSNHGGDGNMEVEEEEDMEFLVPLEVSSPAPGLTNISTTMVDSGEYETSTSAFFRRLLDDLRQQQEERLRDADSDSPRSVLEGGSAHSATSMASGNSGASSHADSGSSLNLIQIASGPDTVNYRSHTAAMVSSLMLSGVDERPYHPMDDYFVYMLRRREVETHNVQLVYDRARTHGLPPSEEEEEQTVPTLNVQLVYDRARTHGLPPSSDDDVDDDNNNDDEEEEGLVEAFNPVATIPTLHSLSPSQRRQKDSSNYTSSPPPASPAASVASISSIGQEILGGHESYDLTASSQQYHQKLLHEEWYESVDVSKQTLSPMNEDSPDNVMDARLGVSSMMTKSSKKKDQPNIDSHRKLPSSTKISSILRLDEDSLNEEDEEDYDFDDLHSGVKTTEIGRPKTVQEDRPVSVASFLPMIDALEDEEEE